MNKGFTFHLISLCFTGLLMGLFMLSCDDGDRKQRRKPTAENRDPVVSHSRRQNLNQRERRKPRGCEPKSVSLPATDCTFYLPRLSHGDFYTGRYADPNDVHNTNDGGPIFGLGQWSCENGEWKVSKSPICRTCFKHRSFRECVEFWNIQYCMFEGECPSSSSRN